MGGLDSNQNRRPPDFPCRYFPLDSKAEILYYVAIEYIHVGYIGEL